MRDNYLEISKLTDQKEVFELFKVVSANGGILRFVGGAVRDALKGIKNSDLNLVTDLSPEELVEACTDAGFDTCPLGIKQSKTGVIIGNTQVEVSSLSKYVNRDGVNELEFTDNWEADASRRDLTINAVYADEKGNVFDYYNGIEDLEKGYVRFIGAAPNRIKEDYVRILRYFRFYSMYGLEEPNKKSLEACIENCAGLKKVPMERIRNELFKLIRTKNAPRAYRLMQSNGVLSYILPDAQYIDDLEFFNLATANKDFSDDGLVKMFILYRPNKALAENLATRLKFSRREKQLFVALAAEDVPLDDFFNSNRLNKIIYEQGADFAKAKLMTTAARFRTIADNLWDVYDKISQISEPVFPLKGKDIMDNAAVNNKRVGVLLKELEQIWIDSDFSLTKEQLLSELDNLKEVV